MYEWGLLARHRLPAASTPLPLAESEGP
jgi:hypothetical protein